MRRIIALIMGAVFVLLALATPANAGGAGGDRCPNVMGTATVNLQCNPDGSVTQLSPRAPTCIGGYFDALHMRYVNCQDLSAPHRFDDYLTISMSRNSIAVDGASDQLASFYRSKSGRTLRFTLRQKATFVNAVYAKVVPTSTDGYGEDVINVRRPAGKMNYKFVTPRGWYVQFVYIELPPTPFDDSATGNGSVCIEGLGCG